MKCRPFKSKEASARALVFRLLLLVYIVAVAYLCFANFDKTPDIQKFIFGIPTDKLVHFCMFFPFPIIFFFASDKRSSSMIKAMSSFVLACSYGCIFAGITEIVQAMLPYRTEDLADFGADCLAICSSALFTYIADIYTIVKNKKK